MEGALVTVERRSRLSNGIGYLRLIDTERTKELGQRINYEVFLPGSNEPTRAVDLSCDDA